MMTGEKLGLIRSCEAGGMKLRTGLLRVFPAGAVLSTKSTILLNERARGCDTPDETKVGRVSEGLEGR